MGRCIAESELEEFHHGENVIPVVELIAIATITSEWTVTQTRGQEPQCRPPGSANATVARLPWQKAILTRCNGMTCITTAAGVSHRSLL